MRKAKVFIGLLATLLLTVGAAIVLPSGKAFAHRSDAVPPALVNAKSWELTSVEFSSPSSAVAVGYATDPSTAPVALVWNGTSWATTTTPYPAGGAVLLSVTSVPGTDDAIAAGQECNDVACPQAFILEWNGSSWAKMKIPDLKEQLDLEGVTALSSNDAWAVGQSCKDQKYKCNALILHWNGTEWSLVPGLHLSSIGGYLYGVAAVSSTDVWAVGGSYFGALALNWNGKTWENVNVPSSGFGSALDFVSAVPDTSEVWTIEAASGGQVALEWDGTSWIASNFPHRSTGPLSDYQLSEIAATSARNAWVEGSSYSDSGTIPALILHYNGKKWGLATTPKLYPQNYLYGLAAPTSDEAVAVGAGGSPFESCGSGSCSVGIALSWNGTSWSKVDLPTPTVPDEATPHASVLVQRR